MTRATVKHYHDLGLLPPALFTGPNMAYYDPECVDRIRLVRELRAERHLPLRMIAQMIEGQGTEHIAAALQRSRLLRDELLGALAGERQSPVTRRELLAVPGIDADVVDALEELGLVRRVSAGGRRRYDPLSLKLVRALGAARSSGLTEEAGLDMGDLRIYIDRLQALVRAETRLFNDRIVGRFDPATEEQITRAALEAAGAIVLAIRDRLLADQLVGEASPR